MFLVIGGGIGGLAAAVALRQRGLEVAVFEQAPELREIGAGLSVWTNATRVLRQLGVFEALLERAQVLDRVLMRTRRGRVLAEIHAVSQFDTPSVCVHRAELLEVLAKQLPQECVYLGHTFESFEQQGDRVVARFRNGREVPGQALIGADGLDSAVRNQLLGDKRPVYRGYCSWRGVAPFALPPEYARAASESWGPGQRFGIEPLSRGRAFYYATANVPEGALGEPSTWKPELLARFGDWHRPIPELIQATPPEAILRHQIVDRQPVRRWGRGRVTLLGDAAHPTTPNLGQGACMAIEDAPVLADCLSRDGDVPAALRRYESLRFRRTAFITRESRLLGWVGQWENPVVAAMRTLGVVLSPRFLMEHRHRQYLAYNATTAAAARGSAATAGLL